MLATLPEIVEKNISTWLSESYDEETRQTIQKLLDENQEEKLVDAFYKDLEFGTGGLRGIIGVGTNRMNRYTVGRATQGFANYLNKAFKDEKIKVAIAYDSRNFSTEFAQITAEVFAGNGIEVYLFKELRPTPLLSFAIRHLACHSGVVLTASHNPKEYNGYKAYWQDGSQLVAPHDKAVMDEVKKVQVADIQYSKENIHLIGEEVDKAYLEELKKISLISQEEAKKANLKIVFTPIHGTAIISVPPALEQLGFDVHIVESQATIDGNFPTVIYPNPEEAEALKIALEEAKKIDADIVMATDPDADRVGIAVKNLKNEWELVNGNQTAALLIAYILKKWKEEGKVTGKEYVVKTIVTTELLAEIANHFGVKSYDTLTGFKNIAKIIRDLEGKEQFIAGGEESYGYLIGDFVRDKDAVASCAFIAQMLAEAKLQGKSLFENLVDIYKDFGFYLETLISIKKEGKAGTEAIQKMMQDFRENPPQSLAGSRVTQVLDYQSSTLKNLQDNTTENLAFDKSNVLQFITEDGTKVSARPSGTEPKIKFYISVKTTLDSKEEFESKKESLEEKIKQVKNDLGV